MGYVKADESDRFLKLPINYSIVTNVDYEHRIFIKIIRVGVLSSSLLKRIHQLESL